MTTFCEALLCSWPNHSFMAQLYLFHMLMASDGFKDTADFALRVAGSFALPKLSIANRHPCPSANGTSAHSASQRHTLLTITKHTHLCYNGPYRRAFNAQATAEDEDGVQYDIEHA